MTDAEPGSDILTLNSGSSSLKFGLYRVGSSGTDMLLSGEAESIGDKKSKFYAQDSRENTLLSERVSIPSQREAIIRIGRFLVSTCGCYRLRAAAYSIGSFGHPLRAREAATVLGFAV
jgi:acetate kinase